MSYNATIVWKRDGEVTAIGVVEVHEPTPDALLVVRGNGRQCTGHEGWDYEANVLWRELETSTLVDEYAIYRGTEAYRSALRLGIGEVVSRLEAGGYFEDAEELVRYTRDDIEELKRLAALTELADVCSGVTV